MPSRRALLTDAARVAAMLAAAGVLPGLAQAQAAGYPQAAFDAKTLADAMKALGGAMPAASKDVVLTGPDIAENGAVVPLGVSTTLPGARRLMLLVEKNPNLLSAVFELSDAVEPNIATRVKMAQSSNVYAVVQAADGRFFFTQKEVKVTLGGCGV